MKIIIFSLVGVLFVSSLFAADARPLSVGTTRGKQVISPEIMKHTVFMMVKKFGKSHQKRIETGVRQAASMWRREDGKGADFEKFCLEFFIAEPKIFSGTFARLQKNMESLQGNFLRITRDLF